MSQENLSQVRHKQECRLHATEDAYKLEISGFRIRRILLSIYYIGYKGADRTPVPEGVSVVMRGPEKIVHKCLETCLECKKIEGDWLESWCGPRNPRWPPKWRLFLKKMPVPL